MSEPVNFLQALTLSSGAIGRLFLVAFVGFLFVRKGWLSDESVGGLTKLMIDVIVPCALSVPMIRAFNMETLAVASPAMLLPALYIPTTVLIVLAFFRVWRGSNHSADMAVSAVAAIPNSFYVPLPLALAIMPPEQHVLVTVYIGAAVLAVNPLQWTLGSWLVMGERSEESRNWRRSLKQTLNGPIIGIVGGALLSFVPGFSEAANGEEGSSFLLRTVLGAMSFLGQAMSPLAMIIIGALIARSRLRHVVTLRRLLPVVLCRFVIVPGLVWLLISRGYVPASGLLYFVIMLGAACPPAMNMALMARRYDGEWEVVSAMQLVTNILAIAILPLWMSVALSGH